ncbi:hypothetical protein TNCV_4184001 [Trichonephila clavipes]|nr:hypothetical protein TNCV_4184001 [Trichonephila clavipes]
METTPEMDLDIELINGLDDPTPVNEQPLPIDDSRPGTPHLTNCSRDMVISPVVGFLSFQYDENPLLGICQVTICTLKEAINLSCINMS